MLGFSSLDSSSSDVIKPTSFSPANFDTVPPLGPGINCGLIKTRHYQPPTMGQQAPTWYFDVSQAPVAGRPVVGTGTTNTIPAMMTVNTANLVGREFGCYQPEWCPSCL